WEVVCMHRLIFRITPGLLVLAIVSAGTTVSAVRAQFSTERQDEQTLLTGGVALARATPPEQMPAVPKLLHDPAPDVRLRPALALAETHDAEAIPVLIDLLADLPAEQRHPIEEFFQQLAGEWAPAVNFRGEDEIARKIRRDAWASWWKNIEGQSLLAA